MIKDFKIDAFSKPVSDLADMPEISAGELKAHFDSNSYELLESLNGLIEYLGGDNALGEMKVSGKSLIELLEQKVSKEEGKGLSTNDYTTEEKNKLASLADFDESAIRQSLSGKVDKEEGKGLSTNDYTTAEKNKLAGLKNYNDSSLKQSLSGKVDKEEGKGLSTNDYTTEEKNKLASLSNYDDSQLRKLIGSISGTFREIDYADIDDKTLSKGIYKLVNIPENESGTETSTDGIFSNDGTLKIYSTEELLFISDYMFRNSIDEYDYEYGILQVRYCGDGTILRRICYEGDNTWTKWIEFSQKVTSELRELIETKMQFKGEIEEKDLPIDDNKKGDVYKLTTGETEDRAYIYDKIYFDESQKICVFSVNNFVDLLTEEEVALYNEAIFNGDDTSFTLSIDFYTKDWEYITTISDIYYSEATYFGFWVSDNYLNSLPDGLEEGVTYYFVRSDGVMPANADISKNTFQIDSKIPSNMYADYAIYNDETFDKFYNADKVDDKYDKNFKSFLDVTMSEFGEKVSEEIWETASIATEDTKYELITKEIQPIKNQIGSIETALDEIIALQNSYTGGESE